MIVRAELGSKLSLVKQTIIPKMNFSVSQKWSFTQNLHSCFTSKEDETITKKSLKHDIVTQLFESKKILNETKTDCRTIIDTLSTVFKSNRHLRSSSFNEIESQHQLTPKSLSFWLWWPLVVALILFMARMHQRLYRDESRRRNLSRNLVTYFFL